MVHTAPLTVKKKFEAVFVTVAMTDGHCWRDLTNIVHMTALKTNTRLKQKARRHTATCDQRDKCFINTQTHQQYDRLQRAAIEVT